MQDILYEIPVKGSFNPTPKGVVTHWYKNTTLDCDCLSVCGTIQVCEVPENGRAKFTGLKNLYLKCRYGALPPAFSRLIQTLFCLFLLWFDKMFCVSC